MTDKYSAYVYAGDWKTVDAVVDAFKGTRFRTEVLAHEVCDEGGSYLLVWYASDRDQRTVLAILDLFGNDLTLMSVGPHAEDAGNPDLPSPDPDAA